MSSTGHLIVASHWLGEAGRAGQDLRHLHPARRHPGHRLALPGAARAPCSRRATESGEPPVPAQPRDRVPAGRDRRLPGPRLDQGAAVHAHGGGGGAGGGRPAHPADRAAAARASGWPTWTMCRRRPRSASGWPRCCRWSRAPPARAPRSWAATRWALPPRGDRVLVLPGDPGHVRGHAATTCSRAGRAQRGRRAGLRRRLPRRLRLGADRGQGVPGLRVPAQLRGLRLVPDRVRALVLLLLLRW